jgi:hypothetical protein
VFPIYRLQVISDDGTRVIEFPGGGPLERDLLATCTDAIAKRIGLFARHAQVKVAVAEGLDEVFKALKHDTRLIPK